MRTEEKPGVRPLGRVLLWAGRLLFVGLLIAGVLWLVRPVPRLAVSMSPGTAAWMLVREMLAAGRGFLPQSGGMLRQAVWGLIAAEIWGLVFLPLWAVAASWFFKFLLGTLP